MDKQLEKLAVQSLIEKAYREGYRDGLGCADYGMVVNVDEDRDWKDSDAHDLVLEMYETKND